MTESFAFVAPESSPVLRPQASALDDMRPVSLPACEHASVSGGCHCTQGKSETVIITPGPRDNRSTTAPQRHNEGTKGPQLSPPGPPTPSLSRFSRTTI